MRQQLKKPTCPFVRLFVCTQVVFLSPVTYWQLFAALRNLATLYADQLDRQRGGTNYLYLRPWPFCIYLKIDVSVCTLSQLLSVTKAMFLLVFQFPYILQIFV